MKKGAKHDIIIYQIHGGGFVAKFSNPDERKVPKYPVPIVYAGEHDLHDPYLSPAYGDYRDFPQMLIQTGEAELLLSDSDVVVRKEKEQELVL